MEALVPRCSTEAIQRRFGYDAASGVSVPQLPRYSRTHAARCPRRVGQRASKWLCVPRVTTLSPASILSSGPSPFDRISHRISIS